MPHRQRATHSVQQCVYATLGNAPISIYCETETEMNLKGETTSAAAAAGAAVSLLFYFWPRLLGNT